MANNNTTTESKTMTYETLAVELADKINSMDIEQNEIETMIETAANEAGLDSAKLYRHALHSYQRYITPSKVSAEAVMELGCNKR